MKLRAIVAAIGAAGMLLAGLSRTTTASAAPTAPVMHRSYSMPRIQTGHPIYSGWSKKAGTWKIAPSAVYFGTGIGYAAPRIARIHWARYGHNTAYAYVRAYKDTCKPTCAAGGYWVNARASFFAPVSHSGPGWYFSGVEITYKHGGVYLRAYIDGHGLWYVDY